MINVYCTYDTISEEFSTPWFAKNDNVARRNLLIAAKRQNLPLNDVKLYCIGCYNEDDGTLYDNNCEGITLPKLELVMPTDENKKE